MTRQGGWAAKVERELRRKTTKVRVTLSVEIDVQAWRDEYGDQSISVADIREAVRTGALTAVREPGIIVPAGVIVDAEGLDR